MISPKHHRQVARLTVVLVLAAMSSAFASHEAKPPDSVDVVQALMPDSTTLSGKVVYVDFWASWCLPCRHSMPWMEKLYRQYHKQGLEIVAVNLDRDHKAALKFLDENRATFPVVFDSAGGLAERYGLETMPSAFLYDRGGHLRSQYNGFQEDETGRLDSLVKQLLDEGKAP